MIHHDGGAGQDDLEKPSVRLLTERPSPTTNAFSSARKLILSD
jgi:hypothetical protein